MSLEAAFIFRSLPLIHRIIHQKRGTKNYWHRGNGKKEASSNKFSFPRLIVVPLSIHLLVEYISRQQISSLFLFYSFIYGCKSWKCCTIIKPLSFWLLHKCHSRTDSSQSWVWWCTKGKGKVNRCSTLNSVWLSQRHRVMNYRKETNDLQLVAQDFSSLMLTRERAVVGKLMSSW